MGPDGCIVEQDKAELEALKEERLREQAARGKMPGKMIMEVGPTPEWRHQ